MRQVALVSGASSGFGRIIADALAGAGHAVYASMLDLSGENAAQAAELEAAARSRGVELHAIELDVQREVSAAAAVDRIVAKRGRLDVLVHTTPATWSTAPAKRSLRSSWPSCMTSTCWVASG